MKRVDEYQRDVVMMSKINESDQRTEKLKKDKVMPYSSMTNTTQHPVPVISVISFMPDAALGRAAGAAHGHQAQQRNGAAEGHSEHGENEEDARTQGMIIVCCFTRVCHSTRAFFELCLAAAASSH
jgi:hypothetical protein